MQVPTIQGEVVTLCCFDLKPCTVAILRELQTTIPRYAIACMGGRYVEMRLLAFDHEALERLNPSTTSDAQAAEKGGGNLSPSFRKAEVAA